EARFHALWALEGIGALDAALVRAMMEDPSPRMRVQAIRASETLYKAGDLSFADEYRRLAHDADVDVAIHALLALNVLGAPGAADIIRDVAATNSAEGVALVADAILNAPADLDVAGSLSRTATELASLERGHETFQQTCVECHGRTGQGTPGPNGQPLAPALAGNSRVTGHPDAVIKTLLHGLTGPIAGRTYAGALMVPQGQSDEWVADVASYIRTNLTNNGFTVTPEMVARVRAATTDRTAPWTESELDMSVPHELVRQPTWTGTASHSAPTRIGMTG